MPPKTLKMKSEGLRKIVASRDSIKPDISAMEVKSSDTMSPIDYSVEGLSGAVRRLHQARAALEKKLAPVLRSDALLEKAECDDMDVNNSPLKNALDTITMLIDEEVEAIYTIEGRIDL